MQKNSPGLPASTRSALTSVDIRGGAIENEHRLMGVVVDSRGEILDHWGDCNFTVYTRSAIKPMQSLPWLIAGHDKKLNLRAEHISLACSSHCAEPFHLKVIRQWTQQLNLKESSLHCGKEIPKNDLAVEAMIKNGDRPSAFHNCCSGKHLGILGMCQCEGWDLENYSDYYHPSQIKIREVVGEIMAVDLDSAPWGIDGCGFPTYCVPLYNLALGAARLADPASIGSEFILPIKLMEQAIAAYPYFYGGTNEYCSDFVSEMKGKAFVKIGAEGAMIAWLPELKIGVAVSCIDGQERAAELFMTQILENTGIEVKFFDSTIRNKAGRVAGERALLKNPMSFYNLDSAQPSQEI